MSGWLTKALREGKRRSGWAVPDEGYEAAAQDFLRALLDPDRATRVVHDIAAFAERIAPAGVANSLAQTVLRLTAPGIPDLYQGTEFWDFSLVDPDNRSPVDFPARESALAAGTAPRALLAHWRDGRVKQAVIARALALRERSPGLFTLGSYVPLRVEGPAADHLLAFLRVHEGRAAVAAVTRLATRLGLRDTPLLPASAWEGTSIIVPRNIAGRRIVDVLAPEGAQSEARARIEVASLLGGLPVALLEVR